MRCEVGRMLDIIYNIFFETAFFGVTTLGFCHYVPNVVMDVIT